MIILKFIGPDKDIVIDGGDKITISGGEETAIFKITSGNVEIRNIILKDGLSQGGNGQGPLGKGANRYYWDNEIESGKKTVHKVTSLQIDDDGEK